MRAAGTPRSRSQRALTACGLEQRAQHQLAGRAERERQAERGTQPGGEGVVGAGAAGLGELIHSSLSAICTPPQRLASYSAAEASHQASRRRR